MPRFLAAVFLVVAMLAFPGIAMAAAPDTEQVVAAVLETETGADLIAVLDSGEAAAAVIRDAIAAGIPGWEGFSRAQAEQTLSLMLGPEIRNLEAARAKVESIASLRKSNELRFIVDESLMDPAEYGVAEGDSEAVRASKWINNASNTTRGDPAEIEAVAAILEEAVATTDLRSLDHLAALNRVLVNDATARRYRPISLAGGNLASSTGGYELLYVMLGNISNKESGRNLGAYLYGAIVRCHGFADGNGRTGRAAYAISLLKAGRDFEAPTLAAENQLHGLDD